MAQETLWGHDDERLAPGTKSLSAEAVEILRGGGGIDDLQVVFGGEMEEAFEARAGMLRALALEAVREQQDQAAELLPFFLSTGDELVHDGLSRVPEITVLSFP